MIIDDNELDRYILKRFIDKTEVIGTCFEAYDGLNAIEFLTENSLNPNAKPDDFPPNILFLDINMPRVNGFEFLERYTQLKNQFAELNPCILMFTSSASEIDKQKAFSFDSVCGYIEKGNFSIESLKELIIKHA